MISPRGKYFKKGGEETSQELFLRDLSRRGIPRYLDGREL
jgi:hypothetical protein